MALRNEIFLIIIFSLVLLNISLVISEEFGYNLLESGEGLNPSTNFSTKNVNRSDYWDDLDTPADITSNGMWTRTGALVNPTNIADTIYTEGQFQDEGLTDGGVLFADTGGVIATDASFLQWGDSDNRLSVGKTVDANVKLDVQSTADNEVPLRLQGTGSQSGNFFQVEAGGDTHTRMTSTGSWFFNSEGLADSDFFVGGSTGTLINANAGTGDVSFQAGDVLIDGDNNKLLLGAGQDSSFYYDGVNLICNPKEVGTGEFIVEGNQTIEDNLSVEGIGFFKSDVHNKSIVIEEAGGGEQFEIGLNNLGDLVFKQAGQGNPSLLIKDGITSRYNRISQGNFDFVTTTTGGWTMDLCWYDNDGTSEMCVIGTNNDDIILGKTITDRDRWEFDAPTGEVRQYGSNPSTEVHVERSSGGFSFEFFDVYGKQTGQTDTNLFKFGLVGTSGAPTSSILYGSLDLDNGSPNVDTSKFKFGVDGKLSINQLGSRRKPIDLLEMYQVGDNDGVSLVGYDDKADSSMNYSLDATGIPNFYSNNRIDVNTHLNVTGNITGNEIHGEMWNYTGAGLSFDIDVNDIYYNYTGLDAGYLNGFTYKNDDSADGGDKLVAQIDGVYKISFSMSFNSEANGGLYGISLHHDYNPDTHRNCYARREASSDTGNVGIECFMDLMAGEELGIMVENENTNRDISVQTINLNIVRIGDIL